MELTGIAIGLIAVLIQFLLGTLVGAVILRAACGLLNLVLPRQRKSSDAPPQIQETVLPSTDLPIETGNPYEAPIYQGSAINVDAGTAAIGSPSFGRAMQIMGATFAVLLVTGFAFGMFFSLSSANQVFDAQLGRLFVVIFYAFVGCAQVGVLKVMLPASWLRAFLIVFVMLLICAVLAFGIGGLIYVLTQQG